MTARPLGGQLVRFAVVGAAGTAAFTAAYLVLRSALDAQGAAVLARVLVAVPTSFLNARYTFRSTAGPVRALLAGFGALAAGAALCSAALALAAAAGAQGRLSEVVVLVGANTAAAVLRFTVLRAVLADRGGSHSRSSTASQLRLSPDGQRGLYSGAQRAA